MKKQRVKYLTIIVILMLGVFTNHVIAQDIENFMKEANEARDQMDLDHAVKLYTKVIELDSNNIEALYYRAWSENIWNKSQGLDDFKRVLELDSLHEGALQSLAGSYAILGQYELAEEYETKAIALNPKSSSNLLAQARRANASGDYQKAIEFCNEAIELNDEAQIWLQILERAIAYHKLGKHVESIADFELCFNEFGHGLYSCGDYEMCGDSYKANGNLLQACKYWNISVRIDDPEFDPATDEVKLKVKNNCIK